VPSQVVRRLLRRYIEERLGRPWTPEDVPIDDVESLPPDPSRTA